MRPKSWPKLEGWFGRARAAVETAARERPGLVETYDEAERAAQTDADQIVKKPKAAPKP